MKLFAKEEPQTLAEGHWSVQPIWARYLAVFVGVPAWIGIAYGVLTGDIHSALHRACAVAFAMVALIQLGFVFRGYWRMDI
ncbi:hypothetical protein [Sphingomonas sp. VNH70]|uniref:hypothetical protein n=1 Tax=Sphingomonas silueang TaxID=3156617 RepID=UPI0032B547C9